MFSCIAGGIGALRGPKHGGANEVAFEIQERYGDPAEAEADIRRRMVAKEVIIGFGHPVYTIADPRNAVIKRVAKTLAEETGSLKQILVFREGALSAAVGAQEHVERMHVGVDRSALFVVDHSLDDEHGTADGQPFVHTLEELDDLLLGTVVDDSSESNDVCRRQRIDAEVASNEGDSVGWRFRRQLDDRR